MKLAIWYRGYMAGGEHRVVKVGMMERDLPIAASQKIRNHSHGFDWGDKGPGATQLALAILQDRFGDKYALENYEKLTELCIAGMPVEWDLTDEELDWFKEGRNMAAYFSEKWPTYEKDN